MASRTARKSKDNEPEPSQNLSLNLTFCSVDDLIDELLRRGRPAVIIYTKTERRDEDENPDFDENSGEGLTAISYRRKGLAQTCIGMMDIVKADMIRDYFGGN